MSSSLFQLDFTNEDHIRMVKEYEKGNNIKIIEEQPNNNEIYMYLFTIKDNKIKELCLLQGQKDIKTCTITYNKDCKKIILSATNYALDILEMEEVFIKTKEDDKNIIKYLSDNGYECLGEEQGNIIYLKEREEEITKKRSI